MTAAGDLAVGEFDIDAALPAPGTTTLLEASAGTGKTWAIAALVARYVIEEGVPLERLLVVTFGRAASQELRSRVRERVVGAERALEDATAGRPVEPGDDELLARLLNAEPAELVTRRDRARRALTDFDAATIATIHQFCQLVLRGLGTAGDNDARAELVEDLEDLREQVVDDLYVARFADSTVEPDLSRPDAGALGRRVVGDPQAALRPDDESDLRVRFAHDVRDRLQVRKRRLGVLSYDDLLSRLADALADDTAPARARMRERWQVVLVDEFQDTDPVQWQVFHRAFSGHAAMVLIGDPKQAIYAFRGGDIATYAAARRSATDHATLGVNYRSDGPLVDAVTAVLRGARLGDGIVVREVHAHCPDHRLTGAPHGSPFRLRLVNRRQFPTDPKPPTIGLVREAVAEDLAQDVAELLDSGACFDGEPVRPQDIAVLCATGPQCDVVHQALADAGVPSVVIGASSVFASAGALDWVTLLEALEQPHRSHRVRAAALTAFIGLTVTELTEGGDDLTHALAERLRDWAALLRQRGVAAVLEVATAESDRRPMGGRLLLDQGGERLLTDVRHVGEVLHDVATREDLQLPALLTWLRSQVAETKRDAPDDRARRLDSDVKAVQILTIHKSKGLQYPVVYLPFASDLSVRTDPMPLFHDDDGRRCLDVATRPEPEHLQRAEAELSDERLRLLYVAMTRARSQLVTWWFASQRNIEAATLHRMLMGRGPGEAAVPATVPAISDEDAKERAERWQAEGGPVCELVRPRSRVLGAEAVAPEPVEARRWTRVVDDAWRRTSYTALSSAAAAGDRAVTAFGSEPEATPKQDEPDLPLLAEADAEAGVPAVPSPMAGLPVGATFGSLVHAVLEHADPAAPDRDGSFRDELLHHIAVQRVRWPVDLEAAELADALVQVCDTPLLGEVTLAQVPRADRLCELDFELPLAGGDTWSPGAPEPRLSDLAPLLREHLPPGDPLLPYAETLDHPGHAAQLLRGYLAGSVDVVLRVGGKYLVVDYKTNYLGPWTDPPTPLTTAHYAPARLAAAMAHSSYPLQALLYAVVAHRFLRWRLRDYDPQEHLGGVMYLYLRGMAGPTTPVVDGQRCGVFSWHPPAGLVQAVSDLLDGAAR